MTLFDLRTENRIRPLGLGEFAPRFSWKVQDAEPNYRQRTRRIQVAATPDFENPVWDSREVRSVESHWVPYRGPTLEPRTRYWFRVRVAGKRNQRSLWSQPEWFETALAPGSWPASFVSHQSEGETAPPRVKAFKREFELAFAPVSARVYATALGMYELRLNGKAVTDAVLTAGWTEAAPFLVYQTFDVTGLLDRGSHTLSALVGNDQGSPLAFSAILEVKGDEGQALTVLTDASWRVANAPLSFTEPQRGEVYDARREGRGRWTATSVLPTPEAAPVAQASPAVKRRELLKARRISTPGGGVVLDFGTLTGWVRFTVSGKPGEKVVLSHAEALDVRGNFPAKTQVGNRFEYTLHGADREAFEPRFSFQSFRYVKVEKWTREVEPDAFEAWALYPDRLPSPEFECSSADLNQLHQRLVALQKSGECGWLSWAGEGSSVIVPWNLWRNTGDLRSLEEAWPTMKAWGESVRNRVSRGATEDFAGVAFTTHSMGLLARSARVLGKEREAQFYKTSYKRMVGAFRDEFVTPAGRLAIPTLNAHVLALAFHLIPPEFRGRTFAELMTLVEEGRGFDGTTVGATLLCDVLTQGGQVDRAYERATAGAGEWLYRTVGGLELDPEVSGYQRILFHPRPGGGVSWARSSLETPYGTASLAWSLTAETWTFEMKVPPNSTAVLVHPEGRTEYGSGAWTKSVELSWRHDAPVPDFS